MTRWVFSGFDAKTEAPLSRYGFRLVLTDDEIYEDSSWDWWNPPNPWRRRGSTRSDELILPRVYTIAEDLVAKWSKEYGDPVKVHVRKDGARLFEVD